MFNFKEKLKANTCALLVVVVVLFPSSQTGREMNGQADIRTGGQRDGRTGRQLYYLILINYAVQLARTGAV